MTPLSTCPGKGLFLLGTLLLLAGCGAPAGPAGSGAAFRASAGALPYRPGFRFAETRVLGDRMRLAVWYPTRASPFPGVLSGPFYMPVAGNAAPAPGRFGLIVLSHGSRGGYLNHRATNRVLAQAGYVVVAIHHPGVTWDSPARIGLRISFDRMPAQVSAAIDWALADKVLGPRIDRRRIGAIGYSSGSYGVMAALGADANLYRASHHCFQRHQDKRFCAFEEYREAEEGGLTMRTGRLPGRRDPRIRAVALWAPIGVVYNPGSLRKITARLRLYRAEKDEILRHPWHAAWLSRHLTAQGKAHEVVLVRGAGHFAFITPFPLTAQLVVGEAGRDPDGFDRTAFMPRLAVDVIRYFNAALPAK